MLTLLIGSDWVANSNTILSYIAEDVIQKKSGRILIVPELISHETERQLCAVAGNTSSLYAEVLTFTRLARRVSESLRCSIRPYMDEGGRVVAMAGAIRQLHSKLKAYASVESKPEFLLGLIDAVDEFKRCCISAEDLQNASKKTEGAFSQKLEELSLILEAYDALCAQGKRDPRDQMTWLLEQLEDSDFASKHTVYIDGFPDYTRQHMMIVEHFIKCSPNVTISINTDDVDTSQAAFEKAAATAREIIDIAVRNSIKFEIKTVEPRKSPITQVSTKLFQGRIDVTPELKDKLFVYQTDSVYSECCAAAEQILDVVHNGGRYRDAGIVCSDIAAYKSVLTLVLDRYKIPYYMSGTDDILEKSVITTVLSALDTVIGGFEQGDVLHYLKSPLSPLDLPTCDRVENYAVVWNISGQLWINEWRFHPDGLSQQWTDNAYQQLQELNAARMLLIDPLVNLASDLKAAVSVGQMVEAIYSFLRRIQMARRLSDLADYMDSVGDNRNAQILNQLWEILLSALEQLYDTLGQTNWDLDSFTRLLKLLLGQYNVGTIPTVLDCVCVGTVQSMRCQQTDHLFVLGVTEGSLPAYGGISGVLTDQERAALRQMGVPLTGGALDGLKTHFSEIYGVFCGAHKTITVSCPQEQPSYLYRRLCDFIDCVSPVKLGIGPARVDKLEAASILRKWEAREQAAYLGLTEEYNMLERLSGFTLGTVDRNSITAIYGKELKISASQIDRLAQCRLSYFLQYGLRAKERKKAEVDPAEFGTYVHAVLENTAKRVMDLGGFSKVSLEDTLDIAKEYSDKYALEHFSQLDSVRIEYLFQRNGTELMLIVQELWEEMRQSQFQPIGFEVAFGEDCEMDPIEFSGDDISAKLRGFVDRVDVWKSEHSNFFRVVDYKTGKKDFDYCDVFNGLGLQMLLYLFALEQSGQKLLGEHPVSAGVQYFPARVPIVSTDGSVSEEEVAKVRQKLWTRKGLLLNDEQVLEAMEQGEKPTRLSVTRKKDGTLSGDIASREEFLLLKDYVLKLLKGLVDDISSGNVEPNPYTRGSAHNACTFCPYGAICHPETVPGRRDYKMMDSQRFWEEIRKEMAKLG